LGVMVALLAALSLLEWMLCREASTPLGWVSLGQCSVQKLAARHLCPRTLPHRRARDCPKGDCVWVQHARQCRKAGSLTRGAAGLLTGRDASEGAGRQGGCFVEPCLHGPCRRWRCLQHTHNIHQPPCLDSGPASDHRAYAQEGSRSWSSQLSLISSK
jgi:hypothetical protein